MPTALARAAVGMIVTGVRSAVPESDPSWDRHRRECRSTDAAESVFFSGSSIASLWSRRTAGHSSGSGARDSSTQRRRVDQMAAEFEVYKDTPASTAGDYRLATTRSSLTRTRVKNRRALVSTA
jgi:hypothetical protein